MSVDKLLIRADMRESRSGVTQLLQKSDFVRVEFEDLGVGDFILSDEVCVERKEANDFVLSIMDRRLFGQVAQMKATYLRPVVMLEGDVFNTRSAVSTESLIGALSWLSVIEGVSIVYTRSASESATFLETMVRHAQNGLGYELSLRGAKPKDLKVLSQYVVEGLQSCGPSTAKKLLEHFGSPRKVFTASVEELKGVKGVGAKMAEGFRQMLDHPYK